MIEVRRWAAILTPAPQNSHQVNNPYYIVTVRVTPADRKAAKETAAIVRQHIMHTLNLTWSEVVTARVSIVVHVVVSRIVI
jgi:hypothetical protein